MSPTSYRTALSRDIRLSQSLIIIAEGGAVVKGAAGIFLSRIFRCRDMHRELHHAQNSQRHRAEDHPGAHGLFAGQVGIERADAAEEQHAHEPRALYAQGREAEAVDIQL